VAFPPDLTPSMKGAGRGGKGPGSLITLEGKGEERRERGKYVFIHTHDDDGRGKKRRGRLRSSRAPKKKRELKKGSQFSPGPPVGKREKGKKGGKKEQATSPISPVEEKKNWRRENQYVLAGCLRQGEK